MKSMWTAGLPRALQGMITSQGEQLSNSMKRLLIFSLSIAPLTSSICCTLSHSPPNPHTCGHPKKKKKVRGGACMCKHKHVNTDKRQKKESMADRECVSSGCVMCIPLQGRLKRRFCFPHQRPHAGGFLRPFLTLSLLYSALHE